MRSSISLALLLGFGLSRGRLCIHVGLVRILEQHGVDLATEQHGEFARLVQKWYSKFAWF